MTEVNPKTVRLLRELAQRFEDVEPSGDDESYGDGTDRMSQRVDIGFEMARVILDNLPEEAWHRQGCTS